MFGDTGIGGWISFVFSFALTVLGLIVFIECYKISVKLWRQWKGAQFGKA